MYEGYKVFGPYLRKDGRKHLVLVHKNGHRKTVSYPKYLLEHKIGRYLIGDETCDHEDGDFTNDSLDNLRVLSRKENIQLANVSEIEEFDCPVCDKRFNVFMRMFRHNQLNQGKAGPFCSRHCAGVYSNRQRKRS